MRSIDASTRCRTSGLYVRTVSSSFTSSGMMLRFVPPWIAPTVTTAGSSGEFSRLTIVCSASTISEARTTGSFVDCGDAPWPPIPRTVTSIESPLAMTYPGVYEIVPAGTVAESWKAMT